MVVYTKETDLQWHKLLDKGLEVALVAHANPGEAHGESVGLSRAFDLAEKFGAIPVDHKLSYELMMGYPEQFEAMMRIAGSNHTWLSTTLCIYAGDEQINVEEDIMNTKRTTPKSFGFVEETGGSMSELVLPNNEHYEVLGLRDRMPWIPTKPYWWIQDRIYGIGRVLEDIGFEKEIPCLEWLGLNMPSIPSKQKWKFKNYKRDELESFLYVEVPSEYRNKFNVVRYPNYTLNKQGSMVKVNVDWSKTSEISREKLEFRENYYHVNNSSLLPRFLADGFMETTTSFHNPTLGFFAPAEGYSSQRRQRSKTNDPNFWRISTRGEAVIIQRPIQ